MHERRPRGDDQIWSAGYLPKTYQALTLDAKRNGVIDNLARQPQQTEAQQRGTLDLLKRLNQRHAEERAGQADLAARINSFELAYRMQMAAPEALDLSRESEATKKLYGLDNKNCEVFARNASPPGGLSSAACGSSRSSPGKTPVAMGPSMMCLGRPQQHRDESPHLCRGDGPAGRGLLAISRRAGCSRTLS